MNQIRRPSLCWLLSLNQAMTGSITASHNRAVILMNYKIHYAQYADLRNEVDHPLSDGG